MNSRLAAYGRVISVGAMAAIAIAVAPSPWALAQDSVGAATPRPETDAAQSSAITDAFAFQLCSSSRSSIEAGGPSVARTGSEAKKAGQWKRIARAPISGRTGHSATWDGNEVIFWGGAPPLPRKGKPLRYPPDGAAYDPAGDVWRKLPKAPIGGRVRHVAVWTGDEVIVWGGWSRDNEPLTDGATYDPDTDRWRAIARPDGIMTPIRDAAWTGEEMIVWGYAAEQGASPPIAAAYDPESATWRELPPSGLPAGFELSSAWTGERMITLSYPDDAPAAAAAYDPSTDSWERMGTPIGYSHEPKAIWTGQELVLLGVGGPPIEGNEASAIYVESAGCWSLPSRPPFNVVSVEPVWSGELVNFVGGAYDPKTDTWVETPTRPKGMSREWYSSTWAGDRIVYWSGRDSGGGLRPETNAGFAYVPPAAS